MFLAVVLYWKYLCRSQLYSSTFPKSFCHLPFDSYQTLFLSLRYHIFPYFLSRNSKNTGEKNGVHFVQQSGDVITVSSTIILRNNSEIESTTGWSNSNSTLTPIKNDTNSISSDIYVEEMLNTSYSYQKKKGAGIRDSLPGIINKFG